MIVEDQRDVIAFLSRGETWGSVNATVERRETHASVVFLVGDHAFKLKRAVRYPYLDYSTADRRRHFCEAELAINQRTAPDVYRRILPVVRLADGGLALDGEGDPVDWLIEMQRFAEDALFDRLAESGRLDRFAMESLADTIARFHAEAERRPGAGGAAAVADILDGNVRSFAGIDAAVLDPSRVDQLAPASRQALTAVAALLDRRRSEGFVRHCHGDLHLRNIVACEGRAVLFDAIEFDPSFAEIDVLYDMAFLVMDLEFRRLGRLGSVLLNRYLDVTGDCHGLATLPLFLSMRAAIRSHIDAAAAAAHSSNEAAIELQRGASRYLDLALRYLRCEAPRLIAIGGLSGSGKSRLARELAPYFTPPPGARVVRTDSIRKRLAGVTPETRLAPCDYSEAASRRTYEALYTEVRSALGAGRTVIADAVFARPEERLAIAAVATDAGAPFRGIWLHSAPPLLEERVSRRVHSVSDATPEVVRLQLAFDLGTIDWPKLDSSGPAGSTLASAGDLLGIETSPQS